MFGVDTSNLDMTLSELSSSLHDHNPQWSATLRYLLIPYLSLVVVVGLVGNSAVLYGSVVHNALRQGRVSRILARDLAVTDILVTVTFYIPILCSLVWGRWVLGPVLCGLTHYLYQILLVNKIWVAVLLAAYRVWVVRKPAALRGVIEQKPWVIITLGVAVMSCVALLILELVSKLESELDSKLAIPTQNAFFDPYRLSCYGLNMYKGQALYALVVLTPFIVLPSILYFELQIQLLMKVAVQARRSASRLLNARKGRRLIVGSVLRLVVVVVYTLPAVSMFADLVYHGRRKHVRGGDPVNSEDNRKHNLLLQVLALTYILIPLNCAGPIIYLCVSSAFRAFVRELIGWTKTRTEEVAGTDTERRGWQRLAKRGWQRLAEGVRENRGWQRLAEGVRESRGWQRLAERGWQRLAEGIRESRACQRLTASTIPNDEGIEECRVESHDV